MKERHANEVLAYFIYGAGIAITVIFGIREPLDIVSFFIGIILIAAGSLLIHRSRRSKLWFFR